MSSEGMVKVFNLTDVPTPQLEQYKLTNQHVVVGRALIAPGESAEVEDTTTNRAALSHYVHVGAVSVASVTPAYAVAKAKLESAERKSKKDDSNPAQVFGKKKKD